MLRRASSPGRRGPAHPRRKAGRVWGVSRPVAGGAAGRGQPRQRARGDADENLSGQLRSRLLPSCPPRTPVWETGEGKSEAEPQGSHAAESLLPAAHSQRLCRHTQTHMHTRTHTRTYTHAHAGGLGLIWPPGNPRWARWALGTVPNWQLSPTRSLGALASVSWWPKWASDSGLFPGAASRCPHPIRPTRLYKRVSRVPSSPGCRGEDEPISIKQGLEAAPTFAGLWLGSLPSGRGWGAQGVYLPLTCQTQVGNSVGRGRR